MSDLAILSLSGAGVTVLAVVSLLVMSMRAHDSEKRAGAAAVREQKLAGEIVIAKQDSKTWKETADAQTKRGDMLETEIDELVASMDDGDARARVLQRWVQRRSKASAADVGHPPAVPVDPASAEHRPGPHDLLKPGE